MSHTLSPQRSVSALKLGIVASLSILGFAVVIAEPMHAFGATDSETAIVEVTVAAGLGLACDANNDNSFGSGETLSLPTITFTGDTGTYATTKQVTCKVTTNDTAGYTLSWQITTGSGGVGTGYLINQYEDRITPVGTGSTNNTFAWSVAASESRWGGRVSSTSSGTQVGNLDFGTDTSAEKYARVATGSSVAIRQKSSEAQNGGDRVRVHFRAEIGSSKIQPSGTYRATVNFTAATQ